MIREVWRDIPNYEGIYLVSNIGNVKSLHRDKHVILKHGDDGRGYKIVGLSFRNKSKTVKIHSLVAMSFLNHKPDGTHKVVIDHINNIKTDNRVENLQLISSRENSTKDLKNGTSKYIGVCWDKDRGTWNAKIKINGKTKNLGRFKTEIEASQAYKNALKILNGATAPF